MKGKCSTHLVNVPKASNNSTSGEPDYYNEHGDPVYPHMISVQDQNQKKHLIQFPISTSLEKVRNLVEGSKCPTVLLKADTRADVNLINSKTFDSLFSRKVLGFTSLRIEAYRNNSAVEVLGKFHTFLRWKGKVYSKPFYITNANNSPNMLSRDRCYTLGVIKPCYAVEADSSSSQFQGIPKAVPTQPSINLEKANMQGEHTFSLQK